MEVIQKITIYDILGYTFPGVILIVALIARYQYKLCELDLENGYIIAFIVILGYVVGMVISQLAKLPVYLIAISQDEETDKLADEIDRIGNYAITRALKNAGAIDNDNVILSKKEIVKRYFKFMFADIQADTYYSRIHNYASSELVCKNMAVTCFISTFLTYNVQTIIREELWLLFGIISSILLLRRYMMNKDRKESYTIDWFVQKYSSKDTESYNQWDKHYVMCVQKTKH